MIKSIQLYSLRNEIQKFGCSEVFGQIKAAGFDAVETAGFYGLTAKELKAELDKAGLSVTGLHVPVEEFLKDPKAVCENTLALGSKNAIIPSLSPEKFNIVDEKFTGWCETCASYGVTLGYHNHDFEFANGTDLLKSAAKSCPALKFELDLFWLSVAKISTTDYVKAFKDRLLTLHIKELSKDGLKAYNPFLGDGISKLEECILLAKSYGIKFVVVEMENLNPQIPYTGYLKQAVEFLSRF